MGFLCAVAGFVLSIITIAKLRFLARSGQLRETNTRRNAMLLCKTLRNKRANLFWFSPLILHDVNSATDSRAQLSFRDSIYECERQYLAVQSILECCLGTRLQCCLPLFDGRPPNRDFLSIWNAVFDADQVAWQSDAQRTCVFSSQVRSAYCRFYFKRSK